MSHDCLKLTVYVGERARSGGAYTADALVDWYARHGFAVSALLRGALGFGAAQRLRTDRLLTLSEDLPIVAVAVDRRERIEAALPEVRELVGTGLVTLERARFLWRAAAATELGDAGEDAVKLTLYVGRGERVGRRPAYVALVDELHRCGVAGATVFLGVDGTLHGARRRAAFFAANRGVPLMVVAVGDAAGIAAALHGIAAMAAPIPLATVERVRVCKRDGVLLGAPPAVAETDPSGLGIWQKLAIYAGEQSRYRGRPLYQELVGRLRAAGAAGATGVRGIWGYHGEHAPHGDRFLALRRRVPVVTTCIDTPARSREWFAVIDELTSETGLVTSELVPAFRAPAAPRAVGGLRLSHPGDASR